MDNSEGREVGGIHLKRVRHLWKGWGAGEEETVVAKNAGTKPNKLSCTPKDFLLLLLDFVFTQTVVNLLSTSAWRGIWNLWDLYLYGGIYLEEPWGPLDITGLFQV